MTKASSPLKNWKLHANSQSSHSGGGQKGHVEHNRLRFAWNRLRIVNIGSTSQFKQTWTSRIHGKCYILVEHSAWHELDGYNFDALHIVLEAYASDTLWELMVHGHMGGTGLRGHGRYPRRTRCSGGNLYVLCFETRLTQELRPKVLVCYWYKLYTAAFGHKESVVLLTK